MKAGTHTIYWPAHLMYDSAKPFKARGIVAYKFRDNTRVVIKAGADLHHQIILCGLRLVHQLVAGEKYKHTLFNEDHHCNEEISFGDLQRLIKRTIDSVDSAFDAI